MQLTPLDAKNLLALISRADIKATEVDVFVEVRNKLRDIMAGPPSEAVPADAAGVVVGVAEPAANPEE